MLDLDLGLELDLDLELELELLWLMSAVNINTQAHTQLTGSLIAATDTGDKDGNDNGQLSLTTNSPLPRVARTLVLELCLLLV
jgi:hypothetical protein